MKKKNFLLCFLVFFITACSSGYRAALKDRIIKKNSFSEGIEWSHTWMVSTNKHDLPRVLIIGDSHVEGYYQGVAEKLGNKVYCCKFTTSRSLGDPALIEQLKALFFSYRFDVICFNNGLHGVAYTDEQYNHYLPVVYRLFKKENPGLKLIWVNTTARRVGNNLSEFDKYNVAVINRNKAVEEFARLKNIPLIDYYSISVNHPDYYKNDGIHFNITGVEEEANLVATEILKVLENTKKALKQ